ncbi:CDP-alcohol phosphatidyltransferase family protein [Acidicapsa acidisoli]|uniref:CDP-alcohol phosphatidyltransferase family protein n=1 Tax=Acidicapsa acidisoli TaxID=1615681 RepID=UPI0021DFE7F8|nr:phosphatidylcholine/phosphatidylserine synthase [Acidicapsa acidisoli]
MNSPFAGRLHGEDRVGGRAGARAARMRRGMFLLPSLFTAGSIGAGYFAITQTIDSVNVAGGGAQHLDWAAIAICLAIPFDALDGRIARMTNTTSEFGKELDSLADAITFGVAPCLLAFVWGFHSLPEAMNPDLRRAILQIGSFVCFLYLLCGVSRLARFNISHDPQPRNPGRLDRKYFVGMPIPAAAGMVASTVHFCYGFPIPYWWLAVLWIGLVGLLGFLMVSTWRFWSGKEINFGRRQPFQLLAVLAIVVFVLIRFSSGALFFVALVYMFSGIWARAAYSWSRRRRQMPRDEAETRTAPAFTAEYAQQGNASSGVSAAEQEYARMHREPQMSDAGVGESGEDLRQDSRSDGY